MDRVFYFSATGNSLYLAKRIATEFDTEAVYLDGTAPKEVAADRLILVSPIYSFGLPIPVCRFLTDLKTDAPLIVVLSYGGALLGADRLAYELCREWGYAVRAVYTVKMVENYTLDFSVPRFVSDRALRAAPQAVDRVIEHIRNDEECLPRPQRTMRKVYEKNQKNWHLIGERFSVSEECILCGKCMRICPVGNISITNDKIAFGTHCIACLGCYHRCPQKAIRYRNRKKQNRYICPLIDENEIGAGNGRQVHAVQIEK